MMVSHSAVIVMPGGGYTHEVMEQEGAAEARWLVAHGISAFVLEYRLAPAYVYPAPMLDASRAIRYVRSHAAELCINPARSASGDSPPAAISPDTWQPCTSLATPPPPIPSTASPTAPTSPSSLTVYSRWISTPAPARFPCKPSLARTPRKPPSMPSTLQARLRRHQSLPHLLHHWRQDGRPAQCTEFYEALKAAGVPVELHIFELGAHGTHMGLDQPPACANSPSSPRCLPTGCNFMAGWPHSRRVPARGNPEPQVNRPRICGNSLLHFTSAGLFFACFAPPARAFSSTSPIDAMVYDPSPALGTYPQNSLVLHLHAQARHS